eukprot:1044975-Prymnesium_polylepis.1
MPDRAPSTPGAGRPPGPADPRRDGHATPRRVPARPRPAARARNRRLAARAPLAELTAARRKDSPGRSPSALPAASQALAPGRVLGALRNHKSCSSRSCCYGYVAGMAAQLVAVAADSSSRQTAPA